MTAYLEVPGCGLGRSQLTCVTFHFPSNHRFLLQFETMDVLTIVVTIFGIAEELLERCKRARKCQPEAVRLGLRIQNLVCTLEVARVAFGEAVHIKKRLVDLVIFLEEKLSPLLKRCERPTGTMGRVKYFVRASSLLESLQGAEAELQSLCDDLGLTMLPTIANQLQSLTCKLQTRVTASVEILMQEHQAKTERMLRGVLEDSRQRERASNGDGWERRLHGNICQEQLRISNTVLGEGSFGIVYLGTYFGNDVAIKRATGGHLPANLEAEFRSVLVCASVCSLSGRACPRVEYSGHRITRVT